MNSASDEQVIKLAKWHENEVVRLRKHPNADISSTHGLAEMHGETASTLYMLLAERDAAIMDADMQAREAGNMEYNAHVLMAEITQLKESHERAMIALDKAYVRLGEVEGLRIGLEVECNQLRDWWQEQTKALQHAEAERDQERRDRKEWMRQHAVLDELCTQREAERDGALGLAKRHMDEKHRMQRQAAEDWDVLQQRIKTAETERDALRVALMPFALAAPLDLAPEMDDQYVDTSSDMFYDLTYGYFRNARAALSS